MKTKNTTKWEKTGLLKYLRANKKNDCANLLEECSVLSLKNVEQIKKDKNINSEEFFGSVFPLIRRLFDEKEFVIPSTKFIFDDFLEYHKKNYNNYKELEKTHKNVDGTAELMEMYLLKLNPNHKLP